MNLTVKPFLIARIHGGALERTPTLSAEGDPANHVLFPLFQASQPYHALLHREYTLPATLEVGYSGAKPTVADFYEAAAVFVTGPRGLPGFELDPNDVCWGSRWDGARWRIIHPIHSVIHGFLVRPVGAEAPLRKLLAVAPPADSLALDFVFVLQAP